ncbi:hypothetical protein GOBAR_AA29457 [Gossypium barbadense]|uniref:Uncharacterized protein n=1 Tax=Gossypium barbadense TaxID=3634 RepID=A0A2P5WJK1_GOSBA|nr:hypothetical protein GOBAR_AA29457 [Gossypium barbadense]
MSHHDLLYEKRCVELQERLRQSGQCLSSRKLEIRVAGLGGSARGGGLKEKPTGRWLELQRYGDTQRVVAAEEVRLCTGLGGLHALKEFEGCGCSTMKGKGKNNGVWSE